MSTDEYVPSEDVMRHAYRKTRLLDHHADVFGAFDRFLARVRRDAAREALDGLMHRFELEQGHAAAHHRGLDAQRAKLARMTTETYRDAHYPEESQ